MSECKKCRKYFVEALYAELPSAHQTWFESHLEDCSGCRAEFDAMRDTLGVMARRTTPQPSFEYSQNLWPNLKREIAEIEPAGQRRQTAPGALSRIRLREFRWLLRVAGACALIFSRYHDRQVLLEERYRDASG